MMENFHLLRPYWLLALIPTVFAWWSLYQRQDERRAWKAVIAPHLLDHLMVGRQRQAKIRPVHLLLLVWLLMALSIAGPSWQKEPSPFAEDTAGMIILLKVTPSMLAEDVQPSRLERAKQKLHDLLTLREKNATGLIAYSGSAHLVMPLTQDGRIIELMAQDLEPETMPVEGDALYDAVEAAKALYTRSDKTGSLLVIADTVSPGELAKFGQSDRSKGPPIQFLSINALGALPDNGLAGAAKQLNAKVTTLSVDTGDVKKINLQAKQQLKTVLAEKSGERWKDSGYTLVPLIVFCSLFWARRGWKIS